MANFAFARVPTSAIVAGDENKPPPVRVHVVMIHVPDEFAAERVAANGDAGRHWIDVLPLLIERLAAKWRVELSDEPPRCGANALVVFGSRHGEPCALKACWPEHTTSTEADALRAWDGRGVVRLLAFSDEDNALLLEKLDHRRPLDDVDLRTSAAVVGALIRELSVPAPRGFPASLTARGSATAIPAKQSTLRSPIPAEWARLATGLAEAIAAADGRTLIHTDLHSGNVLAGARSPWLAIDPRPSVGHPERSVPDLLLWRLPLDAPASDVLDLLATMVAAGDLDPERARAWTVIGAVTHWLWCHEEDSKLPPDEPRCTVCPPRCTRILEALT